MSPTKEMVPPLEERKRLVEEYRKVRSEGKDAVTAWAKKAGYSPKTVYDWGRGRGTGAPSQFTRRFTDEQEAAIIAEYQAAVKEQRGREVAVKHKVHPSTIAYWIAKRAGNLPPSMRPTARRAARAKKRPRRTHSEDFKAKVVEAYRNGKYGRDVGREFKINSSLVHRWAKEAGAQKVKKPTDLVATTNKALARINGTAVGITSPGYLIRTVIERLLASGTSVEKISVEGTTCTVTYKVTETFEL